MTKSYFSCVASMLFVIANMSGLITLLEKNFNITRKVITMLSAQFPKLSLFFSQNSKSLHPSSNNDCGACSAYHALSNNLSAGGKKT